MKFLTAVHTDIGIRKQTNQDSALVMEAKTDRGNILLSVVCDGMGGLQKGEVASSTVIRSFSRWFEQDLKRLVADDDPQEKIFNDWKDIIFSCNTTLSAYAGQHGFSMGTTLNAVLFMRGRYYIINIGDSRAYSVTDKITQLTKDQTFVQREMDMGRMTPEEARVSPQRNVLLQCIGASEYIEPVFYTGEYAPGQAFLQCSDGFRHRITEDEMYAYCSPAASVSEKTMLDNLVYLTDLNKYKREPDNITAILVKIE